MPERLGITVTKHIMETQRKIKGVSGNFSSLLSELIVAGKVIHRAVSKAGLIDVLGKTGLTNTQGEEVQKLDDFANTTIIQKMDHTGFLCAMASEEVEDIIEIDAKHPQGGKYTLAFDPLDGSSNIDANVSVGTIFSIHRKITDGKKGSLNDFLQQGKRQVCAGYIIYGSSTMLVYTVGNGVHGFTFDPSVGEFILSHPFIKTPSRGKIFSCNEGNANKWNEKTREVVDYFKAIDEDTGRPYSARYIGSLVSDFHRNLLYGGVFIYPNDQNYLNGKLRLLYEAAPLAMICKQAGGDAISDSEEILEIKPTELHQRVPLFIGSKEDVKVCRRILTSG
jgi:fructose-1,6-bisphosphatase I